MSASAVNPADTAWMLVATALVLLMTPALAFFYGGLVRSKNALNTMMMSFVALGFVGVLWALVGYTLAFSTGGAWVGDLSNDVVAAHGVGGTVGALLTGLFAQISWNGVADGALFGNPRQLLIQATAVVAVAVYSGVASFVLLKVIALVTPLRATPEDETTGLDVTLHGEEAYLHEG
jgi:ammonium transporter, Amt family